MSISVTIRYLKQILNLPSPPTGMTPVPFLGAISSVTSHRLHSVALSTSNLFFVLAGSKTIIHGADRVVVEAGDMFIYPARMETIIENNPNGSSGWYIALCLSYDEAMLGRAAAHSPARQDAPNSLNALKLPCDDVVNASLNHLLHMAQSAPHNERLIDLCREELLLLVGERTGCLSMLWNASSSWGSRCSSLVSMAPSREWTADDIASQLGTSERSLRRHLNNEGTALRTILRDVRLNSGLAMLQSGKVSVGETAYLCGYNSASRFAGLFKERFGVSPSKVLQYNAVLGQHLAES